MQRVITGKYFSVQYTVSYKDKPEALKLDSIYRRLFTFTIKTLTYTYVPVGLARDTHSASIV